MQVFKKFSFLPAVSKKFPAAALKSNELRV